LDLIDMQNLSLSNVAKTFVAVTAFLGAPSRDKIGFEAFVEVLCQCCELKTHDGIIPLTARLENFITHQLLAGIRSRTRINGLLI